jgi:hypothetical protein
MQQSVGAIVNVGSTSNPYYMSLVLEGVWGLPAVDFDDWALLEVGTPVLLFLEHRGVRGVWVEARVIEMFPNVFPVSYWFKHPYSRPFQFRLQYVFPEKVDPEYLDSVEPVGLTELAAFGFKGGNHGGWNIVVYSGHSGRSGFSVFDAIRLELTKKNPLNHG